MCLAGFGAATSDESCGVSVVVSRGCTDASIGELHLTLVFPDRIESWDLQKKEETPSWSMELEPQSESSGVCHLISHTAERHHKYVACHVRGFNSILLVAFLLQDPL